MERSPTLIVELLFQSLNRKDFSMWTDLLTEDCVQNLPYAPPGFPKKFAPRDEIIEHFSEAFARRGAVHFYDLEITEGKTGDIIFAEFKQDSPIPESGRNYTQLYVHKFRFQAGKINVWDEYFDPLRLLNAFGGIEAVRHLMHIQKK